MRKVTQRYIRDCIRHGYVDLDKLYKSEARPKPEDLERFAYSTGIDGINGSLFIGKDGTYYAIAARSTALIYYC